jgi:hypothetical protein
MDLVFDSEDNSDLEDNSDSTLDFDSTVDLTSVEAANLEALIRYQNFLAYVRFMS